MDAPEGAPTDADAEPTDRPRPFSTRPPDGRRPARRTAPSDRGFAPVAVVVLLALTVALAGVVGAAVVGGVASAPADPTATSLSLSVDGETVRLLHRGGDEIDVRELRLRVSVGGERLRHQPPVPFFAAAGFESGPTGPFNAAADPRWTAGETASFAVAGTNDPAPVAGATVRVRLFVGDRPVADLTATA
jgi:FlaG/FlaF family flagellin (archaellin)